MCERVNVDKCGNMADENFRKEFLDEDVVVCPGQDGLTKQSGKRFTPDETERFHGMPKEKRKVGRHIVDRGGNKAAARKTTLNEVVRPRINEKFESLVRMAERCVGIHEEHHDGTLMATTSRFNCHIDIHQMKEEISRYIVANKLFTGNQLKFATQACDSLGAATGALAAMRIADAVERVKEAQKAFSNIREVGTGEKEITLEEIVRPRINGMLENLVRTAEKCVRIHEEHRDDALIARISRFCSHSDIYQLMQEISRYIIVDRMFTGSQLKKATLARDSLGASARVLAAMRIADAAARVKEARKAFSEIRDGGVERPAGRKALRNRAPMIEGAYVDKDGNVSDEEFHREILGDDNQIYLSKERMERFTPDEIARYFGIPKEKQKVGWHIVNR